MEKEKNTIFVDRDVDENEHKIIVSSLLSVLVEINDISPEVVEKVICELELIHKKTQCLDIGLVRKILNMIKEVATK